MSALPLVVKAVLAAGVLASMARAFLGPPAPPAHRHLGRTLLVLTGLCYATGAVLVTVGGAELVGSVVVLAGIEVSCLAAWVVRATPEDGGGGEDDDGGGGGGKGPPDPGPIDWAAFDRERRHWDRSPAAR
jgi:hypothetical protein